VSAENVEIVRQNIEAISASGFDPDVAAMRMHPDVVIHSPDEWPGSADYEGGAGLTAVMAEWRSSFDDLSVVIDQLIDDGDRVIALLEVRGTSKSSAVVVEWRLGYIAAEFADGPPREIRWFMSWEGAREAAGIEAPAD
jgi:ketosteroid isomerase-like protein